MEEKGCQKRKKKAKSLIGRLIIEGIERERLEEYGCKMSVLEAELYFVFCGILFLSLKELTINILL